MRSGGRWPRSTRRSCDTRDRIEQPATRLPRRRSARLDASLGASSRSRRRSCASLERAHARRTWQSSARPYAKINAKQEEPRETRAGPGSGCRAEAVGRARSPRSSASRPSRATSRPTTTARSSGRCPAPYPELRVHRVQLGAAARQRRPFPPRHRHRGAVGNEGARLGRRRHRLHRLELRRRCRPGLDRDHRAQLQPADPVCPHESPYPGNIRAGQPRPRRVRSSATRGTPGTPRAPTSTGR